MDDISLVGNGMYGITSIPNEFIDKFMIEANGEYVKVFMYLIRHFNCGNERIGFQALADVLQLTLKELKMAFRYWDNMGLINLTEENGKITRIVLNNKYSSYKKMRISSGIDEEIKPSKLKQEKKNISKSKSTLNKIDKEIEDNKLHYDEAVMDPKIGNKITSFIAKDDIKRADDDIKQLLSAAEQYLGKILPSSDVRIIESICINMGFGAELTEYLIAHCVSKGHYNLRYIENMATNWKNSGIVSLKEAKMYSRKYINSFYEILTIMQLERDPVKEEVDFMMKWLSEWNFEPVIIKKACEKTMMTAANPSFNYVDAILSNWFSHDVKTLDDITRLDQKHKRKNSGKYRKKANFKERDYDFEQIELEMLSSKV